MTGSTLETGCFSCVLDELTMNKSQITLSRECVRDTLLLKRLCPDKTTGLALSNAAELSFVIRHAERLRDYEGAE